MSTRTAVRLKDVTTYVNRGVAPSYVDDPTGWVAFNQKCVRPDGSIAVNLGRPMADPGPAGRTAVLRAGDVCVNSTGRGTLGRAGFVDAEAAISQALVADGHVTVLRSNSAVLEPRYLWYLLGNDRFYQYANTCLAVGSTNQTELGREALRTLRLHLPDLQEQRQIVEYLDTETTRIDELAAEEDRLVGLVQERASAERERLFLAHDAEARPLASFLAQAPTYGVLVPKFANEGVPFVRVGNITDVQNGLVPNRFIGPGQSAEYRRTILRAEDVLVSVVGSLTHSAVVPPGLAGANVARAVCVLRPLFGVPSSLLAEFVHTRIYQDQAHLATGTDTAQPTLNMGDLARFRVPIPAAADQRADLASRLNTIASESRKLVEELRLNLDILQEHRQALITTAVTGGLEAVGRAA